MNQSKLFIQTESGEMIDMQEIKEISINPAIEDKEVINIPRSCEISFETQKINTVLWLGLSGLPTSNNWRKMHGGVMSRNRRMHG